MKLNKYTPVVLFTSEIFVNVNKLFQQNLSLMATCENIYLFLSHYSLNKCFIAVCKYMKIFFYVKVVLPLELNNQINHVFKFIFLNWLFYRAYIFCSIALLILVSYLKNLKF